MTNPDALDMAVRRVMEEGRVVNSPLCDLGWLHASVIRQWRGVVTPALRSGT